MLVLFLFSDPPAGTPVDQIRVKKIGPYILGPVLGNSPVKSIVQCLARQEKTDKFFTVKVNKHFVFVLLVPKLLRAYLWLAKLAICKVAFEVIHTFIL